MDYDEFKRYVRMCGLSMAEFAALLKVGAPAISKYRKIGQVPNHLGLIAVLLAELVRVGVDVRPVVERAKLARRVREGRDEKIEE